MKHPNFFIVGAPKCGTTAMTRYLEDHPEIFVSAKKDLHYFGSDLGFTNRPRLEAPAYFQHFEAATTEALVGEASVWYLYSTQAASEIHAFDPNARIIMMLRNPVEAMYALFTQLRFNGLGDESIDDFELALAAESDRAQGKRIPPQTPLPKALLYRKATRWVEQVERYQDHFPPSQIHVILQDDLKADTAKVYGSTLCFLGVDETFKPDFTPVNTAKQVRSERLRKLIGKTPGPLKSAFPDDVRQRLRKTIRRFNSEHTKRPALDPTLRAQLTQACRKDVEALGHLIERDLSHWTDPPHPSQG